jgi:outer membrane lipoprotein-sorting protein
LNILRRLPLSRLLLLCGLVVAIGVSATAIASAIDQGQKPPQKNLANAVHDSLVAPVVEGVTARINLTNHLLEGANLASAGGEGGQLASNPLLTGAEGRLWIARDGHIRLELKSEKGDTQVTYDGHTVSMYDASTNTLYRYTPPAREGSTGATQTDQHEPPSVAKIEEKLADLRRHAEVSEPTPGNVAGQEAYTAKISPNEPGSLIGRVELSWDAAHAVPLRAAIYSTSSASPVIELAASDVQYGPVSNSDVEFTPPQGAVVKEVSSTGSGAGQPSGSAGAGGEHPQVTTHGHGISAIAVIEKKTASGEKPPSLPEGLPKVKINGATATEMPTALGTLLSFESSGVRYLLVGSVAPSTIEALARGL